MRQQTGEEKAYTYLVQRLSMAVQWGNGTCILGGLGSHRHFLTLISEFLLIYLFPCYTFYFVIDYLFLLTHMLYSLNLLFLYFTISYIQFYNVLYCIVLYDFIIIIIIFKNNIVYKKNCLQEGTIKM